MAIQTFLGGVFIFWLQFDVIWGDESPVLLWGADSPSKPALTLVRQYEFADLMKPLFEHAAVVAFLEPNLSTKDLLCRNGATGSSCYSNMIHIKTRSYYARVQSPVEALKSIASQIDVYSMGGSRSLDSLSPCDVGKLTIVNFNQSTTERYKHLQSHDTAIANLSLTLKCPIVYMYTSTPNSFGETVVRGRRSAQGIGTLLQHPLFVMFFKSITLVENHRSTIMKLDSIDVTLGESELSVVLGTELHFNVKIDQGYYIINEFVLKGVHYRAFEVVTPFKMSYYCGNLELANKKSKLILQNFQFQGNHKNLKLVPNQRFKFYDAWHCVGFVTPAILSGLFVVALIILITSIGICWLMDVTSNDRFDDPTKEAIKINFEE